MVEFRRCTRCQTVRPRAEFPVRKETGRIIAQCRPCHLAERFESAQKRAERKRLMRQRFERSRKTQKSNAKRYAKRLVTQCPPWADRSAIRAIYRRAAELGLTVDHVIPLQHPAVCGLHVPANLQLMAHRENSKKGNRWAC